MLQEVMPNCAGCALLNFALVMYKWACNYMKYTAINEYVVTLYYNGYSSRPEYGLSYWPIRGSTQRGS